jgi:hypothetical protein
MVPIPVGTVKLRLSPAVAGLSALKIDSCG